VLLRALRGPESEIETYPRVGFHVNRAGRIAGRQAPRCKDEESDAIIGWLAASGGWGNGDKFQIDFDLMSLPTDGARVVAKALQKYGMFLADARNIALTAQSDRFTTHKWDEVGITAQSLFAIKVTDMEVVDMGPPIDWSGDCVRNPPP
jgi:hypothetical protein